MSANRWSICPKCKIEYEAQLKRQQENLRAAYGKILIEEFLALQDALQKKERRDLKESMRENFEIGMSDDGFLEINYGCFCNVCRFKFDYNERINSGEHSPWEQEAVRSNITIPTKPLGGRRAEGKDGE